MKSLHFFVFVAFCALLETHGGFASQAVAEETITNGDYAAFLSAVATDDSSGSYDTKMGLDAVSGAIMRRGVPGDYRYEVVRGSENDPVTFLSLHDASSYCEWLNAVPNHEVHFFCHTDETDPELRVGGRSFSIFNALEVDSTLMNGSKELTSYSEVLTGVGVVGALCLGGVYAKEYFSTSRESEGEKILKISQENAAAIRQHELEESLLNNAAVPPLSEWEWVPQDTGKKSDWELILPKEDSLESQETASSESKKPILILSGNNSSEEYDVPRLEVSQDPLAAYRELAKEPNKMVTSHHVDEAGGIKLLSHDISTTLGGTITQQVAQHLLADNRSYVDHYQAALQKRYGEKKATEAFPSDAIEHAYFYGLSSKIIFNSLKKATELSVQELMKKIAEHDQKVRSSCSENTLVQQHPEARIIASQDYEELKAIIAETAGLLEEMPPAPRTPLELQEHDPRSPLEKMVGLSINVIDVGMTAQSTVIWTRRTLFVLSLLALL